MIFSATKDRNENPQSVEARFAFPRGTERAEAEAFVAQFPKSLGVKLTTLSTFTEGDYSDTYEVPYVMFSARLIANGVNGGRNETGIRRYRSLVAKCEKLGVEVEWGTRYANAYASREEFEAAIA